MEKLAHFIMINFQKTHTFFNKNIYSAYTNHGMWAMSKPLLVLGMVSQLFLFRQQCSDLGMRL